MVQTHSVDETVISDQHYSCFVVIDVIFVAGLLPTITDIGPFYPKLIREFTVNLPIRISMIMEHLNTRKFMLEVNVFLFLQLS